MIHRRAISRGTDRTPKQRHFAETWARNPHKLLGATTVSAEGDVSWYLYCWLNIAHVILTSGEMMMMMTYDDDDDDASETKTFPTEVSTRNHPM